MEPDQREFWIDMQDGVEVPRDVAVCPECGGDLWVMAEAWETKTDCPVADSLTIECDKNTYGDGTFRHRWWQSDWQPVRDAVTKWCGAR